MGAELHAVPTDKPRDPRRASALVRAAVLAELERQCDGLDALAGLVSVQITVWLPAGKGDGISIEIDPRTRRRFVA